MPAKAGSFIKQHELPKSSENKNKKLAQNLKIESKFLKREKQNKQQQKQKALWERGFKLNFFNLCEKMFENRENASNTT